MGQTETVSGNTVSGNTMPLPETVTNNNTYTIDNTDVCNLLSALLQEEVKQNGALEQLNGTLSDYIQRLTESGLLDNLQAYVSETETEAETETETLYGEELLDLLGTINDTLAGSYETLDSINTTVSGNNAFLDSMDGTATILYGAYTEQAEKDTETDSYSLSIGITAIFLIAVLGGILLSGTVWHKMR